MRISALFIQLCFAACIAASFACCDKSPNKTWFSKLDPNDSHITFSNDIHDEDSGFSFINEFGYMGGGVGIGDFNNDGLPDIFFTGNQVSSRLYINKDKLTFEDVTEKAGVTTNEWCTGVSVADINADGYDDIYVSVFGKDLKTRSKNLLFINQHDLTFKEQAVDYGVADTGYSTQAAFLDYDMDGDLDMYLVNYLLSTKNGNSIYPRDRSGRSPANDRLYRNDGDSSKTGHPHFTDVTMQAGIKEDGYGLGISVSDYNGDGFPDIYIGNDFLSNDILWLNKGDGTFSNCIDKSMRHQSYSCMGTDAADINNDSRPDLITLDMLPEWNERKKIAFSFMNQDRYDAERAMGYEPEFMRNMLQVNIGNRINDDKSIPSFSEIGELSGIEATDWSWSALIADFNADGRKDLHITNGIGRDFINADFMEFSQSVFSRSLSPAEQKNEISKRLISLKHVTLPNYLFINDGNLHFTDGSKLAGIAEPGMSNGAAYADLDNDGDLDIVVNNINSDAFIFINNSIAALKKGVPHYISFLLKGDAANRRGFGAKVFVYQDSIVQLLEQFPVRGYFSTVDSRLIFGLGDNARIDSVVVVWPDAKQQVIQNPGADQLMTLSYSNAKEKVSKPALIVPPLFSDITGTLGVNYLHQENPFNDYAFQRLLPQKYSQLGPFITTGDIDGDGQKDFFIGGAFNISGAMFTQSSDGRFNEKLFADSVKIEEDADCLLFDADNDGDQDLLITSGDMKFQENSAYYTPRLYYNDGKGHFRYHPEAIPEKARTIAGTVVSGDYDHDGDADLFIGGRVSKKYPLPPASYILENNKGVFTDVTDKICPALKHPGMITSAVWTDINNDHKVDLVIAGEWMPLRFFINQGNKLVDVTSSSGLKEMNGMWRCLVGDDVDDDGDVDLIAGNLGLNCDYRVSEKEPMELYAADLDGNQSTDPVFFYYINNEKGEKRSSPGMSRNLLAEQMPFIKKQFLLHSDFAQATVDDIFNGHRKDSALRLFCDESRTCVFENTGKGKFVKHALSIEAQFAPVNAIICGDFDKDGKKDLLIAGNEYQAEVTRGRYDASYGLFLKGNGSGQFSAIDPISSGFIVDGDVKDMAVITTKDHHMNVLVAINNDSLRMFSVKDGFRKKITD
jgi:hypothetical protein